MKPLLVLATTVLVLSACQHKRTEVRYYYAMDSLVTAQSQYLAGAKAVLKKQAVINGKPETAAYTPKSDTTWQYELEVFNGLNDVNKPTNIGKYHVEKAAKDVNSNLLVYSLEAPVEAEKKLPVKYLKLYYLETLANIRKIEGVFSEENTLFRGSRKMTLEFQAINNKIVLTSYSIQGDQKMLTGDPVSFSVHGTITLP